MFHVEQHMGQSAARRIGAYFWGDECLGGWCGVGITPQSMWAFMWQQMTPYGPLVNENH